MNDSGSNKHYFNKYVGCTGYVSGSVMCWAYMVNNAVESLHSHRAYHWLKVNQINKAYPSTPSWSFLWLFWLFVYVTTPWVSVLATQKSSTHFLNKNIQSLWVCVHKKKSPFHRTWLPPIKNKLKLTINTSLVISIDFYLVGVDVI